MAQVLLVGAILAPQGSAAVSSALQRALGRAGAAGLRIRYHHVLSRARVVVPCAVSRVLLSLLLRHLVPGPPGRSVLGIDGMAPWNAAAKGSGLRAQSAVAGRDGVRSSHVPLREGHGQSAENQPDVAGGDPLSGRHGTLWK